MYRILKLVLLVVAANCAPPLTQQSFYYAAPQPQLHFQYQPLLRFQQLASPASINTIPSKEQYVLFYPTVSQLPLMALRQDEGTNPDVWSQVTNWWAGLTNGWNQSPATSPAPSPGESSGSSDAKSENLMMKKAVEPAEPLPLVPASTMPLTMNKQLFVVSSLPQFYGNFAAFHPAVSSPVLIPAIASGRSTVDSIPAENEQVEQPEGVNELSQKPVVLAPGAPLQLRNNFVEPLQRLELDQPQIPLMNNEPVPEVAAQQLARFLDEVRSEADPQNSLSEKPINDDAEKLRTEANASEEDGSIAQAKPSGIALSGKGGVSSSAPQATAVVGERGLALASPSAIALSGDFKNDEEMKIAPME